MASSTPVPSTLLMDGTAIPILGYGTGTAWFKKKGETGVNRELVESIKAAIKLGYHHLDGAEVYGTEAELGVAIKESGVPREKLFVTTKVNQNIADIPGAIQSSLDKLQLSYVDLYLIHQPFFAKSPTELQDAWAALEKVKQAGKARSIGVSNFLESHLSTILQTAKIPPSINQIEFHPYLQHGSLVPFQEQQSITTASYGPLTPAVRAKGGPLDSLLSKLASKYAVGEGEVLLRWSIDRGAVTITTSGKEARLSSYLNALNFQLTPEEVKEISRLGEQKHFRAFWNDKFAADDRS
ncbi:NADP-dependent oxidoreductase domain-containing protein [Aspergillus karnatakaensis]|uniref:aldo/keto reductase n=1 Tax=Aspergillus karnatakaensis TaxID=1810916 RepID=UPI003CCD1534